MSYAKSRKIVKHGKPPKPPKPPKTIKTLKSEGCIMKKFVKVIIAIVALIATLFGFSMLTGCSREPNITVVVPTTATVAPETTEMETTTTTEYVSQEDLFLQHVDSNTTIMGNVPVNKIIDFGYAVCDYLRSGGTGGDIAQMIAENSIGAGIGVDGAKEFGTVSVLAVQDLCPDQTDQMRIGLTD